jgi:hypothetical protein
VETPYPGGIIRILIDRSIIIIDDRRSTSVIIISICHILLRTYVHRVLLSLSIQLRACLGILIQVFFFEGQTVFFIIA